MGEYATYNGQSVKIGTCEQMYYLRADQVPLIQPESGNVNPRRRSHAEQIQFRFPFPREDGIEPGAFEDHDYGMGVWGIEPPDDPEQIEHCHLQFTRNYPESGGILLSIPCPRSREGKASGLKVHYNGYNGAVQLHSQRLVDGRLVLILRCGDCGALYRVPTLDDAKPVLDILEKEAAAEDHRTKIANQRPGAVQCASAGDYYREVARRIVAGYTEPNFWTDETATLKAA